MIRKALLLGTCFLLLAASVAWVHAAVINVPDAGNGILTIQDGVDAASDGDTVVVAAGTYESFNFSGKAITVESASGAEVTFVEGTAGTSGVLFNSGEGSGSLLRGFTIRQSGELWGSGIRLSGSSPVIEENVIENNTDLDTGAGVHGVNSSPIIRNNTIRNNQVTRFGAGGTPPRGGGIYLTGTGSPAIVNNFILNNSQDCGLGTCTDAFGAGIYVDGGSPSIVGNVLASNVTADAAREWGGGLYIAGTTGAIVANNTFYKNTARTGTLLPPKNGGAAMYVEGDNISLLVANNIVQENNGYGVLCGSGLTWTLETNDLYANTVSDYEDCPAGVSDLFVDAEMVDPANGDVHLASTSPLIDSGTNGVGGLPVLDIYGEARTVDGDGNGSAVIDIGAAEYPAAGVWAAASQVRAATLGSRTGDVSRTVNITAFLLIPVGFGSIWSWSRKRSHPRTRKATSR